MPGSQRPEKHYRHPRPEDAKSRRAGSGGPQWWSENPAAPADCSKAAASVEIPVMADNWFNQWKAAGAAINQMQVFFVLGCQKSGTTWLQKLLSAHPNIICRGESHLADGLAPLLQAAFNGYNQQQVGSGRTQPDAGLTEADLRATVRMVGDAIFAKYVKSAADKAVRAVGERTPEHAVAIRALANLWPDSRFIHIIRDGRDGAVSGWAHLERDGLKDRFPSFSEYAGYFAEHHWSHYVREARAAGETIPDRYLELRYEELQLDASKHTKRMLEFLGVDAAADAVRVCVEGGSFEKISGRTPGGENRASHLRKGIVGDWKAHFDDAALCRFEAHAGPLLRELGYAA